MLICAQHDNISNPLSVYPTKWSNALKQLVGKKVNTHFEFPDFFYEWACTTLTFYSKTPVFGKNTKYTHWSPFEIQIHHIHIQDASQNLLANKKLSKNKTK